MSWQKKNISCPAVKNSSLTTDAYKYKTASELHEIPFTGEYDVYGGGGYVQDLPNNRDTVNSVLGEITKYRWLDRSTRAVLIEFSLYNSNINLLAYAMFSVEFTDTGTVLAKTFIQFFRPSLLTDATGTFSLLCYAAYLIAIIIATFKIVGKCREYRSKFVMVVWNVIDLITILLSYAAIAVWIVKYLETTSALKRYYDDKSAFISFGGIVNWDIAFTSIIGIIAFTATLRILKALGYNKRMAELTNIVYHAAPDLISFSVIFAFAFVGFAILGHLLFGASMYEYHSMLAASGSLANSLIGKVALDKMLKAAPNFAQLYFFCYVLFVIFVLLTMFAAILNESITKVREDYEKEESPIGMVNLITSTLKDLLGMLGIHIGSKKRKSNIPSSMYIIYRKVIFFHDIFAYCIIYLILITQWLLYVLNKS